MRLKAVPRWLGDIALVLVGAIIGAAVYHAMHLHQFNELMMMNIDLQDRLAHYKAEAEDLLRYKNRRTIVKSIEVHIYEPATGTALPQAHETEIRRRLLKDLSGLKGRDVFQIDEHSKLVEGLLANKIYPDVHEKDYSVLLRTMLVTEGVLHVWVDVKPYIPAKVP